MMKLFFGAWALYALIFIVAPFGIPASGNLGALGVLFGFAASVAIACWLTERFLVLPSGLQGRLADDGFRFIMWSGIVLSVTGFALLIYDRIVIQNIDFSYGLAYARAQWTDFGQNRNTPSSIFSVTGYLLGSVYFASLVMALNRMTLLSRMELAMLLASVFALAMANSAITGGRSILLLLVGFTICGLCLRKGGSLGTVLRGKYFKRGCFALGVLMLAYVSYITLDRAWNADITMEAYLRDAVAYLKLDLSDWYALHLRHSALSTISAPLVYIGAYLTHSYAILCEIVQGPEENKVIVFGHLLGLLAKLGLVAPPEGDWFLAGRFPTLPGALWHQFGPVGMVAGGLVLGAVAGLARRCYQAMPDFVLFQGFQVCVGTILVLSPLLFAGDLMIFPFIVIGFILLAGLQLIIGYRRSTATG